MLRKELNDIALQQCQEKVKDFVECSKASGLLVVFQCREKNKVMNACLSQFTSEEEYKKYKLQRQEQLTLPN